MAFVPARLGGGLARHGGVVTTPPFVGGQHVYSCVCGSDTRVCGDWMIGFLLL